MLEPQTVAVVDQVHAEMSALLTDMIEAARPVLDEHGIEYGALVVSGHLQLDTSWTVETLAGMLSVALARLAVTS